MSDDVVYLVAPTGHPNFGDEYIAAAWLRALARRRPRSRVVLDCPNPGVAAVLHAGLHPRLTVTDTLFRLAEEAGRDVPDGPGRWDEAARRAEALVGDASLLDDTAPRLKPGLALLRAASTVHALGGGWVNDIWPDKIAVLAAATAAVAGLPEPPRVSATGMGLAPGGGHDDTMSRVWRRFDLVDVRDAPSVDIARTAVGTESEAEGPRITCSGDDAWVVLADGDLEDNGLGTGVDDARARPIVLCLQGDLLAAPESSDEPESPEAPSAVEALADAVIAAVRSWADSEAGDRDQPPTGADIAVVEAIPGVDRHVWRAIAAKAPELAEGARFVDFAELWDRGLPARAGQTWLTTRFHPHLIAAARGARGVALDVHVEGYYSVKHGSVVAAGSRWPVVSLDDVAAATPGRGLTERDVERRRGAKEVVVDEIYPVNALVEGATGVAVKGRRAVRRAADRLRGERG